MKNLLIYFSIIILICFINRCKTPDEKHETIYFEREDFNQQFDLKGERIVLDSIMYDNNPLSHTLIRDSLVFVSYWDGTPYFLKIFNLNTMENVANLARKGRGPNEYLSCMLNYRTADNYFYIFDGARRQGSRYNIDSVLLLGKSYTPINVKLPNYTRNFMFLNDSTIIGYNGFYFNHEKFGNKVDPLFKMNLQDDIDDLIDLTNADYFTFNVSNAHIFISPEENYLWLIDRFKDRIDVYNKDFEIIKTYIGPDNITPEYEIRPRSDNSVRLKNYRWESYPYPGYYTKNALYLLYHGIDGAHRNYVPSTTEVFKFSWSGELLARYHLDKLILGITVDSDENYIYGAHSPHWFGSEINELIRYKIPE